MKELRIVAAKCHLGAFMTDTEGFFTTLERKPDFVGMQASSVDFGPYYLGAGACNKSRTKYVEDVGLTLPNSLHAGAKVIFGGLGYSGESSQVDWGVEVVREIAARHQLSFKLAVIYADISQDYLMKRARQEKIHNFEIPDRDLTPDDVKTSSHIVGMMGYEPFERALSLGADVIVTGRCCDAAIYAAPAIQAGFDKGLAWHMGTLMECAGFVAWPMYCGVPVLAIADDNGFTLETLSRLSKVSVESVTDHQLYERAHALRETVPGGYVDYSNAAYREEAPGRVRISGMKFVPTPYEILVQGAGPAGFRSVAIGGIRDPLVTQHCRELEESAKEHISHEVGDPADLKIRFINYGIDGVLGPYEHRPPSMPHEVGVIIDVIAGTQELAEDVAQRLAFALEEEAAYPARVFGVFNLAAPLSPRVQNYGVAYRFTINHLLPVEDPCELFPITLYDVQGEKFTKIAKPV